MVQTISVAVHDSTLQASLLSVKTTMLTTFSLLIKEKLVPVIVRVLPPNMLPEATSTAVIVRL